MVVELLRSSTMHAPAIETLFDPLLSREIPPRPTKSTIHPPTKRAPKRVEYTSALQLAQELHQGDQLDSARLSKLAQLTVLQIHQGSANERLKLYFALSQFLCSTHIVDESIKRIASVLLGQTYPLFMAVAPSLRWTALAGLATIIERPYFSATAKKLGAGYLCALLPEALESAAARDKAPVYCMLLDITQRGFVKTENRNRILRTVARYLHIALGETNAILRRQIIDQHISLLESGSLTHTEAALQMQAAIRAFSPEIIETLNETERAHYERSLRRVLI